ncbi:MAG: YhfC family intramembrane metalloprotease [Candidatus Moranbacteria bacterium]|nr:YhfC family intramembrane metalloprotease [Candidatus Moranbacteria bacterium]
MITFLIYGILTALFALVAEIMSGSFLPDAGLSAIRAAELPPLLILVLTIVILATIEETLKYIVLQKTLRQHSGTRSVPASFLFGIGFATTELLLLFLVQKTTFPNDLFPIFGIFTIHVATSALYGTYGARLTDWKRFIPIFVGITFHAAYNLLLALI